MKTDTLQSNVNTGKDFLMANTGHGMGTGRRKPNMHSLSEKKTVNVSRGMKTVHCRSNPPFSKTISEISHYIPLSRRVSEGIAGDWVLAHNARDYRRVFRYDETGLWGMLVYLYFSQTGLYGKMRISGGHLDRQTCSVEISVLAVIQKQQSNRTLVTIPDNLPRFDENPKILSQ
jgi:hypothetical protein